MIDIESIILMIGSGLKLVDQFRDLALKFIGKKPTPPSAIAEKSGNAIEIKSHGRVVQRIEGNSLRLNEFDNVRFRALDQRVKLNWTLFNELYAQLPILSIDERVRIEIRVSKIKEELCQDLREIVGLYEGVLGVGLPDHYSLHEICAEG
jgi:hypothetical protein